MRTAAPRRPATGWANGGVSAVKRRPAAQSESHLHGSTSVAIVRSNQRARIHSPLESPSDGFSSASAPGTIERMAKLVVFEDQGRREYELHGTTTIGRHDANTIQILDGMLSKQHLQISNQGGTWILQDLNSTNGTFVNGTRAGTVQLNDGDALQLGTTKAVFSNPPGTPAQAFHRAATLPANNMPIPAAKPAFQPPTPSWTQAAGVQAAAAAATGTPPQRQMPKGVTIMSSALPAVMAAKLEGEANNRDFVPVEQINDIEQLKSDYEKLRVANELNKAIGLESDADALLVKILDETFNLIPAERGVILLVDEAGELKPRAVKRAKKGDDEIVLSNTILTEVIQKRDAVLTNDAMMDSRFSGSQSIIATGMRATMVVPMISSSNALLGILHLDSTFATNAFSRKDLKLLTGVANQAAQAIDNANKAKELERNALARRDFERLLPPEIVEQVVTGKIQLERGGEERQTTLLFSDVRGFTSWSEKHQHEPSYIVAILNEYFEAMVECIHDHHGTLDKFMGDGIMALFGAPVSYDNDALNAVLCAMDMMAKLTEFNRNLMARSNEQLSIGVGLNTGPVVVGYMGSTKSMEYTAIGDGVNLAARLCGIAKPGQILVSDSTYQMCRHAVEVQPLEPVNVKGKRQPIPVYELLRLRGQSGFAHTASEDTGVHLVPPHPK
jgi:adenylate cyclase